MEGNEEQRANAPVVFDGFREVKTFSFYFQEKVIKVISINKIIY